MKCETLVCKQPYNVVLLQVLCVCFFIIILLQKKKSQHNDEKKRNKEKYAIQLSVSVLLLNFGVLLFFFSFLNAIFDQVVIFFWFSVFFLLSHRMCPDLSVSFFIYECAFSLHLATQETGLNCYMFCVYFAGNYLGCFWFELKPIHVINSIRIQYAVLLFCYTQIQNQVSD